MNYVIKISLCLICAEARRNWANLRRKWAEIRGWGAIWGRRLGTIAPPRRIYRRLAPRRRYFKPLGGRTAGDALITKVENSPDRTCGYGSCRYLRPARVRHPCGGHVTVKSEPSGALLR
jgi:hypothetical protein